VNWVQLKQENWLVGRSVFAKHDGLALLEVLFSSVLIGLFAAAFSQLVLTSIQLSHSHEVRLLAQELAQLRLANLRLTDLSQAVDRTTRQQEEHRGVTFSVETETSTIDVDTKQLRVRVTAPHYQLTDVERSMVVVLSGWR
jgi:Tfp pilus assembly protein PilV